MQNHKINKGFKAYNALQVFNCSMWIFIQSKSNSCSVSALGTPLSITCFPTWNASWSHAPFQLFIWHAFFAPHMTSSFPSTLWPFHYFHSMVISSLHDNPNVTHPWNRCATVWPKNPVVSYARPLIRQFLSIFCFSKHFSQIKNLCKATSGRF